MIMDLLNQLIDLVFGAKISVVHEVQRLHSFIVLLSSWLAFFADFDLDRVV